MKNLLTNFPVLSIVKYSALFLFFVLGFDVAAKHYPQSSMMIGVAIGFAFGLRLSLMKKDKQSESD